MNSNTPTLPPDHGRPQPLYLRARDIVRPHGVLPISRATFYAWVADGKVPPGIALSPGIVVWPRHQILSLVEG